MNTKSEVRLAAPGQGLTFWTLLYSVLGPYGLYQGVTHSNVNLLIPGVVFTVSSLGIWLGISAARWLLFGFLLLMSSVSLILMISKGFQLHKAVTVLAALSCCLQLFLWNPTMRGQSQAN